MANESLNNPNNSPDQSSCDPSVGRKEFLEKIIKRAALVGGLAAAPAVLDKFLIQSVAAASTCSGTRADTSPGGSGCQDQDPVKGIVLTGNNEDTYACAVPGFFDGVPVKNCNSALWK